MSCSLFVSIAVRCWYHQDILVVLCIVHHVVVWLFTLSRISIPVSPYCVFVSRSSFFCLGLLFFLVSRSLSHFYLFVVPRVCFVSQFRWFVSGNRFFCSRYFFLFAVCLLSSLSCYLAFHRFTELSSRSRWSFDRLITSTDWSRVDPCVTVSLFFVTLFRWLVFTRNRLFVIVFLGIAVSWGIVVSRLSRLAPMFRGVSRIVRLSDKHVIGSFCLSCSWSQVFRSFCHVVVLSRCHKSSYTDHVVCSLSFVLFVFFVFCVVFCRFLFRFVVFFVTVFLWYTVSLSHRTCSGSSLLVR